MRIGLVTAMATAIAIGAVVVLGGGGGPPAGFAHVFISASGNDSTCQRNVAAVTYAAALAASPINVCATGPVAYTKANPGDAVLVEGSYVATSSWTFAKGINKTITAGQCDYNYGGASDFRQCVTIEPDTGQSLTFNVPGNTINQVDVCVSGLSIQNATITETDYSEAGTGAEAGQTHIIANNSLTVGAGDNRCGTAVAPHDDYFYNLTYGGPVHVTGGVSNVYLVGGTAASTKETSWGFGGNGNNSNNCAPTVGVCFPFVHDSGIINMEFQGYNFINHSYNSPAHHMECVHVNGSLQNSFFAGDKFEDCPVESLFFETLNGTADIIGNTVENNVFDNLGGLGGGPFKWDCSGLGCTVSNNIIRFNSLTGPWLLQCDGKAGQCNMNNNTFYGNVGIGCAAITFASGTGITGNGFVSTGYNVQSGAQSNTCAGDSLSLYNKTITYNSPGTPNYDLTLSGTQDATNLVPNTVTWPLSGTDIEGTVLSGPTTNAGAYDGGISTGASLATCSGGTCTEGALPSTTFTNDCTATPLPGFATAGTGKGVRLGTISDGVGSPCRGYYLYVPNGLTGSAPVLVYAHGSNGCPDSDAYSDITTSHLDTAANTNKFIIVSLEMPKPCSGRPVDTFAIPTQIPPANYQWFHHESDIPDSGSLVPQDQTYIQQAVADIKARLDGSSGSGFSGLTADPKRFWYMGQSSGGGLATGIMCVDATSSLFRGFLYNGVSNNVATTGGSSPSPINGTERCGGGGEPTATNKKFFLSLVVARANKTGFCATSFTAGSPSPDGHCTPTFAETAAYFQSHFGCSAPTVLPQGSPSAINELDTFSCAYGSSPQVQLWFVSGSGDGYTTAVAQPNGWVFQNVFDFMNSSTWTGP